MIAKANLIIYDIMNNGNIFVYLQRRSKTAKMFPDCFSFWGGGIENGETPEQAMIREIKEELDYIPEYYDYLGKYETPGCLKHVFYSRIRTNIISKLSILEGQYGEWFDYNSTTTEMNIIQEDINIIKNFINRINGMVMKTCWAVD